MLGAGKNTVQIIIAAKDRTKAAFAKVNTQMKTMKGGTGRLTGAMNSLKGGLSNVSSSLGSFGAALGPVGIAVAAAAVVMATLGGAAIKASLEFEKAFATIRVGTGTIGKVLTGLESSFKTVFTAVPASAADIATTIADLNTRLGLTGAALEARATQFLNLSRITGTDVAASISSATRVMHDFDVSAQEQAGTLDYLFKVSQSFGIGLTQLGNSMTQYGSVMRQMGFDINESAVLLGKFEKEGVNLELVLGSLRQGLAKFSKAGEEPVEALQRVTTEIQGMGSVADANTLAIEVFGARAGPDMAAAIREGRFEISEMVAVIDASSETINKAAADTLQFGDKWTLLKNNVTEAIAPIGDVITNVLGNAMEGLSGAFDTLQKVAGPVLDLIFIKFKVLQAFFSGLAGPIIAALEPLKKAFGDLTEKFKGGIDVLQILKDVTTIATGVAKDFGKAIGWLVAKALTPFTEKLKADIDMLSAFYDKLGPLKDLIEFVGGGIHNLAESYRDHTEAIKTAMDAVDAMTLSAESFANATAAPIKGLKDWKIAFDAFEEGAGSFKEAVGAIDAEIEKLKDQWKTASEDEKKYLEDGIRYLSDKKTALEEQDKVATEYFDNVINGTDKAIEKTKEFIVTIGNTTIEFKGAAAEVVKNADAYEKLQKSAQTLIDLDWSVFTDFEAALPSIAAGIGDMESSFVGLKGVLEDNIVELENVKQSVMDIAEIAAPFLEAGFLDGIKAIGDFAGSLSDAGSAINTFSSLQEVSMDGCINFSMHVHDMVSALQILEGQMEDLVPSFGNMDSLINGIADAFLYGGGKMTGFVDDFDSAVSRSRDILYAGADDFVSFRDIVDKAMDAGELTYMAEYIPPDSDFIRKQWKTITVEGAEDVRRAMFGWFGNFTAEFETTVGTITSGTEKIYDTYDTATMSLHKWLLETYGVKISQEELYAVMESPPDEQKKWLDDVMHSEKALTFQMDKQTNALKAQTGQLAKITEALQPYLEFMRTLNELAALSTLSTEQLNNGLNSIKDTLTNLGSALSTFDLRPVMESLFGTKIPEGEDLAGKFTGGIAKGFTDVMAEYRSEFSVLIEYVSRLSSAISSLVNSFEALTNISESVLADQTKLKEVFEGIADVMTNFSAEMGGTEGFAQKFATGMDAMLKSAGPLILYFRDNNAAVEEFNGALLSFKTTITSVIDVFEALASVVKRSSDLVVISAQEIEDALSLVDDQLIQIGLYLQTDAWSEIVTQLSAVSVEWGKWAMEVDKSMPAFSSATDTFSTLISKILGLSTALKDMRDMSVLSVRDIDEALKNIPVFLDRFVDALALNMGAIKESLKALDKEWALHTEEMKAVMPSYEDSTAAIGKLIGSLLSLHTALESLSEMGTISEHEFDKGFKSLMTSISNFAVSLSNNVDDLIFSLQKLRTVWVENEAALFPLIYDFAIITDNLWGVAHNANRMAEEFSNISKNSKTLEKGFESLIKFIDQVVKSTKEFYTTEAAAELKTFIEDVGKVIDAFVDLEKDLDTAMGKVEKAISDAVGDVRGKISSLSKLPETAYTHGASTLQSFVNGLIALEPALIAEMEHIVQIIHDYIGVESPTKLGPLRDIEQWPRNLVQSYSSGIEAEMHTLNASFSGLAPGMGASSVGGSSKSVIINNTQYINSRADADYSTDQLRRLMTRHEVM